MPIKNMSAAQIAEATRATIAAGGKSTDKANRLPGETASEANARITAGYKELTAKPILSQEQIDAGMKVQFVRGAAGGVGEYTTVKPFGYTGPTTVTQFTPGIIPASSKYTTGSAVGLDTGGRTAEEFRKVLVGKLVAGNPLTPQEKAWLDANGGTTGTTGATKVTGSTTKTSVGYENKNGVLYYNGAPFSGRTPDGKTYTNGIVEDGGTTGDKTATSAPVGTPPAFVYNKTTGKWEQPTKPTEPGSWVWDNTKGWTNTTVNPGSSGTTTEGGPTLAKDTFKNTLALFFGAAEMSQPWVDILYKSAANFYNSGSTIDEAINMSLQDVRNNPTMKPFTDRFAGVYALQDRLAKGEAVTVPTVAEFFKSESAMGDVLRSSGLGELATQQFLGDVLGRGKSVLEVSNLINETFKSIDNAPDALKKDLQTYFPGVDRTSLAKALLTGTQGWEELSKKVRMVSSLSAAKSQGVTVSEATAQDIANMGYDYNQSLQGFQKVKELERGQMLGQISGINFGQEQAIGATFKQDAQAMADIEKIKQAEAARFSGSAGRLASRSRNVGLF